MKHLTQLIVAAVITGTRMAAQIQTQVAADYRLKPGDQIAITFSLAGQPQVQLEMPLDRTGQFDLPLPSGVVCSYLLSGNGKTTRKVAADVQGVLNRYAPGVTAAVTVTSGGRTSDTVTFCGEVKGVIFLERKVNSHVAAAVQFMGPSHFANLRNVIVNRLNPDGTTRTFSVNVEKIIRSGYQGDVALQAGDIVDVPASYLPHNKPVTDRVLVPIDPQKLFCEMSHKQPVRPKALKPVAALAKPNIPSERSLQLAAR